MERQHSTLAQCALLIRAPVATVFTALTDKDWLTKFWLSKASDSLAAGKTVHWEFMVPGAEVDTHVVELEPNRRIAIEWSDRTFVTFTFETIDAGTVVRVENGGFQGDEGAIVAAAIEATQGFSIVLCDLKTLLESGTSASLVRDKALLIQRKQQC